MTRPAASFLAALALTVSTGGCATTIGLIHATTGQWPSTSSSEEIDWVNGPPATVVTVEARLTTPPRVICRTEVTEPEAVTTFSESGVDFGGRLAIGFIGFGELAMGLLPMALAGDELGPGGYAALGFLALDGLASLALAALIPNHDRRWSQPRAAAAWESPDCPPGLFFEIGLERFPLDASGALSPGDARYLMTEIVEAGVPIGLRNGDRLDLTPVPPEIRCAWADHLGHAAARALCPQAPIVIERPPPPPRRVLVPVPPPPRR